MDDPRHLKRGNLLWESSRMFLPEHKEQLLEHRRKLREFVPPELDEDRIRLMDERLGEALASGRKVAVTIAGTYEPETRFGRVTRLDPFRRRLRLETVDGPEWIPFANLLHVEWASSLSEDAAFDEPPGNPRSSGHLPRSSGPSERL